MLLHRKAVHPEFFGIESKRRLAHADFDVDAWIFRGGHAVRFQHGAAPTAVRPASGGVSLNGTGANGEIHSSSGGRASGATPTAARSLGDARSGGSGGGLASGLAAGRGAGRDAADSPETGPCCICEVVTDQPDALFDSGPSASFPCAGEHDHEERLSATVLYMTTIQTETLSEHLYVGTYKEMMQHVRESNSLFSAWTDELGRPNLSLLDLQRYRNEIHLQAYHLRSDCGLVLRTQSMFQVEAARPAARRGTR